MLVKQLNIVKINTLFMETMYQQEKNLFFEQVKKFLTEMSENEILQKINMEDFETMGALCFITGVDYVGQAYKQKSVMSNVRKRFEELKLSDSVIKTFEYKINFLKDSNISEVYADEIKRSKELPMKEIEVAPENQLAFIDVKAKIKNILNQLIIPISLAKGLFDIKQNKLTYDALYKLNSLINQNSSYSGKIYRSLSQLYGNELFNTLLKNMIRIYDNAKYAIIYEESFQACIDSVNRFKFDLSEITEEQESENRKTFEQKEQERAETNREESGDEQNEKYQQKQYTKEESEKIFNENPELLVKTLLEEQIEKNLTEDTLLEAIDALIMNEDLLQHIYTYVVTKSKTFSVPNEKFENILKKELQEIGAEYKKLAEINCREIEPEYSERIVQYVNACIESCIMNTEEQKQYLISQLLENGITTYLHLQQILSLIETCNIQGKDVQDYTVLYDYVNDKTNIREVFDNANKLEHLELKMKTYQAFHDFYKVGDTSKDAPIEDSK